MSKEPTGKNLGTVLYILGQLQKGMEAVNTKLDDSISKLDDRVKILELDMAGRLQVQKEKIEKAQNSPQNTDVTKAVLAIIGLVSALISMVLLFKELVK